jgi:hypothetical protein
LGQYFLAGETLGLAVGKGDFILDFALAVICELLAQHEAEGAGVGNHQYIRLVGMDELMVLDVFGKSLLQVASPLEEFNEVLASFIGDVLEEVEGPPVDVLFDLRPVHFSREFEEFEHP